MGATFDTFHASSTAEVEKTFKRRTDDTCNKHDEGNSYCGCMCQKSSLHWANETFADSDAAYAWAEENSDKHDYQAYVAGYYVAAKRTDAVKARIKKASDKVTAAKTARRELLVKFRAEFAEAKSKFVKCRNTACESSIRRTLVEYSNCPVCRASMLSPTCHKRLATHDAKVKKLEAARDKIVTKSSKPTKKIHYIVGAICAE